jgi:tetratricopeptide (TPR) repeat protein
MDFSDQITAGEKAVAAGRADAAIAVAEGLCAAGCTEVSVFAFHARALDLALRPLAALAVLGDGLALHPHSGRLRVERGKILFRQGDTAQAEAAFDDALTVDPRQMEAVKGILALRPMPLDDPRLALVETTAQEADRPPNKRAKAFYILGQVWLEAGEIDPAMTFYAQANALMAAGHDPATLEYLSLIHI